MLILKLIRQNKLDAQNDQDYEYLFARADKLPTRLEDIIRDPHVIDGLRRVDILYRSNDQLVSYLQSNVQWDRIKPYLRLPVDSISIFEGMWKRKEHENNSYSICILKKEHPDTLYHYTSVHKDKVPDDAKLKGLFKENKLRFNAPESFNDPFDCAFAAQVEKGFKGKAMTCFSSEKNNVLMFSHYANYHKGICLGFNVGRLINSICSLNKVDTSLRPIWYFNQVPPFEMNDEIALCATCKDDIWSYEQEYRLFLLDGDRLLDFNPQAPDYRFDANAFTSIILGHSIEDSSKKLVKSMTEHLSGTDICYFRAKKQDNKFGIELGKILWSDI